MDKEKDLKERIEELENRIDELEDKERKRKTLKIIKISVKVALWLIIIIGIWRAYTYVNDKYIKPLDNILESTSEITNTVDFSKIGDWFKSFK